MNIAQTTIATLGNQQTLAMLGNITDLLIGFCIEHHGAGGNTNFQVFAASAGHLLAGAIMAALGTEQALVTEIHQSIQTLVSHQINTATVAAVAAIRTTPRNVLLAPKTDNAMTAVSCFYTNRGFINKLHPKTFLLFITALAMLGFTIRQSMCKFC